MKINCIKILASLTIITTVGSFLVFPPKVKAIDAVVVTADPTVVVGIGAQTAAQVANFGTQVLRWVKEDLWKTLRDVVSRRIIQYIVDQTLVWIQGNGKPKFVTDWEGFVKDAGNIAFDSVINNSPFYALCEPFRLNVKVSLQFPRFNQQITCTLDKVVKNINDFYADFSKGGWLAYSESWAPQNNYYGQMILFNDQILTTVNSKTQAAKNDAQAGKGFLSVKSCLQYDETPINNCVQDKINQSTAGAMGICRQDYPDLPDGEPNPGFWDCVNQYQPDPEYISAANSECQQQFPQSSLKCMPGQEKIQTPGDAIGQAVGKAITSDSDWAASIQSWTSALVTALISRLEKEGLQALKGSGPGGQPSQLPNTQSLVQAQTSSQNQTLVSQISTYTNEWTAIYNSKQQSTDYLRQAINLLNQMKGMSCQTSTSDSEIIPLINDLSAINTAVTDLNSKITEANNAVSTVNNAVTIEDQYLSQQTVASFISKYNTSDFQTQVSSGSARTAAKQETDAKKAILDGVNARFTTCTTTTTSSTNIQI